MPIGVIFDMDGVLVDSGPAHMESWRRLAQQRGRLFREADFHACFGKTSRDIIRTLWGERLSEADITGLDTEKEEIYRDLIRDAVPLLPGCREALAALRGARLRLAVATSGPPPNLALVLKAGRIGAYFDARVHGFDIQRGKPAPDCFLLAAERLGCPPAECVVVEDALPGVAAGLAAGMTVIAITGTQPEPVLRGAGAAAVVSELRQITPELVRSLVARGEERSG
jgi:beta-phosphoglucomutase